MKKDLTKVTSPEMILVNGEAQESLMTKVRLSEKGVRMDEAVSRAEKKE